MGHLFISYSRDDRKKVKKLVAHLEKAGHNVWLDTHDIEGGDQWRQAIVSAIKSGHALIVAISPKSVSSENVRKELDVAEGASVRIIPVRLQEAAVPDALQYQLAGIQEIDLSKNFSQGIPRLLRVLGEDKTVEREAGGRRLKRLAFWTVCGALVGAMLGTAVVEPPSLVGGLAIGAVLGFASGFMFKLIGWIILWLAVVLAGAVTGGWVEWMLAGRPEKFVHNALYLAAGAIAAVVVTLLFKRWRKRRKRAKLRAMAQAA